MNQIPNIEETHDTREVEESIKALRPKLLPTTSEMDLYEREVIKEVHHQLQKAREENVKALEVADNDIPPFPSAKDSESARIGFITGVAWSRTRLHSELDQDKPISTTSAQKEEEVSRLDQPTMSKEYQQLLRERENEIMTDLSRETIYEKVIKLDQDKK